MKDSLKKILEEFVKESVKTLEDSRSGVKRIVIFSSGRFTGEIREILNCTENYFLSTQFKINHGEIKVRLIPGYKRDKDLQEGDYIVDLGAYLRPNFPEFF